MNSVRTEPKESLLPYSTRVSSPALKIMHTWGKMEAVWREVGEGALQFRVTSPCLFLFHPHPLPHPSPLAPLTRSSCLLKCGQGIAATHILIFKEIFLIATRLLPGYLQSEEKTSQTMQTITQDKAGGCQWQGREMVFREALTLHKRCAVSDSCPDPHISKRNQSNCGSLYSRK